MGFPLESCIKKQNQHKETMIKKTSELKKIELDLTYQYFLVRTV